MRSDASKEESLAGARVVGRSEGGPLLEQRFRVPSSFLSDISGDGFSGDVDAFASSEEMSSPSEEKTVKELLSDSGVDFPEGTRATFDASSGELIVRNTANNIDLVDQISESLGAAPKPVEELGEVSDRLSVDTGFAFSQATEPSERGRWDSRVPKLSRPPESFALFANEVENGPSSSRSEESQAYGRGLRSGDDSVLLGRLVGESDAEPLVSNSSGPRLLAQERVCREASEEKATEWLLKGREAYADKDYDEAARFYRDSLNSLPFGAQTESKRDEIQAHLADGEVALSEQYQRTGRYDEAKDLLGDVLLVQPELAQANEALEYFDEPIRTNPRVTLEEQIVAKEQSLAATRFAGREQDELVELATEMHDYKEANREYENSLALLQELKLVQSSERVGLRTPEPVVIQEQPKVSKKRGGFLGLGDYESKAAVEVRPGLSLGSELRVPESKQYFDTQKQVATATKTLSLAVEEEGLDKKWGVSKEEAVKRLKSNVKVTQRRGTDILEIKGSNKDPKVAKEIAAAVTSAYQKRRNEEEVRRAESQLDALNAEIENQKDKVEAKRKVLDTIVRITGRPYFEGRAKGSPGNQTQLKMIAERNESDMKKNRDQYRIYLDKLETLESDQLLRYAAEIPVDNNSVRSLHSELLSTRKELNKLKAKGLGENHPSMRVQKERIEGLQKDTDSAVASLRESLMTNFEMVSEQLLVMEATAQPKLTPEEREEKIRKEQSELAELKKKLWAEKRLEAQSSDPDLFADLQSSRRQGLLTNKLQNIIIPRVDFENTPLDEALEYLTQKTLELDPDPDPERKGVNFVLEKGFVDSGFAEVDEELGGGGLLLGNDQSEKSIDVLQLTDVPLATALEYIASKTGLRYRVDDDKVTLLAIGSEGSADLVTRTWSISPEAYAQLMEPPEANVFVAELEEVASEQEALENCGVGFPDGASVRYIASSGSLFVRSTVSNLDLVDQVVEVLNYEAKVAQETLAMDEKDAATEGDSTFSLHVSDVSFKLAKAALEQGKWPETVRVEEFVNAFSYGERALAPNERVGVAMEQAAHPFLSQRNLLRVSLQTAATGRGAGVPLRLTVVLDKSGSMERLDRAAAVDEAFRVLVNQLNPGDKVTLVGFSRTPTLLADHVDGSEGERLLKILRETPSEGGTNVEEALKLARAKALEHFEEGAQNRVILLTDGIANLGESVPEQLMTLVEGMREEDVAFDACGVGVEGLNDDILEALTRKGDGRYYLLGSTEESGADFAKQVAGALRPAAQNVKVQIEWNPERVGKWRLYGYEKHELKKEDFRNDSVDAAEMAAEEEGVALYHVEVKPDGEGPLGVARVRFLDVANNEMVEREWEITHEGEAATLSEADEKMRLAGVAGLVAEKLARSAVGERAEWDELLEMTRQLKTVFPKEKRVSDLERMIELAKGLE